jgi:hypothetical protein
MTNIAQLDCLQDHLGDSLSTPLGTEKILHSMPVSAPAPVIEPVAALETDRAWRSTVAWVALVVVTAALGLFAWLR